MISRRRAMTWIIVISMITGIVTFTLANIVSLRVGDRVVVSKQKYDFYQELNGTFNKMMGLKGFIEENYYKPVNEVDFEDGIIKGLFKSLNDPYSVYMTKDEFEDFMTHTKGTYGGIGVIMTPGEDGFITVVSPIEDTPGAKVGIQSGDKIVKVNEKEVTAEKLDEAVVMIKGDPGTKVNLTILRPGKANPFSVEIQREEIRLQTVKSRILKDDIGYIRITMFDEQTSEDFKEHLTSLQKQNIKGLIIDLRDNPGGLLSECVKIADELLGKQVIVYTEDRAGNREYENSDEGKVNFPYALLVNKGSASASEILAGAVKDSESGVLIGTTTFGKGLVQRVKPLDDGTGFKLTTSQYYTPNGTYIHGKGIEPNIVIEMPEEISEKIEITDEEDVQLQKGIEYLLTKIK